METINNLVQSLRSASKNRDGEAYRRILDRAQAAVIEPARRSLQLLRFEQELAWCRADLANQILQTYRFLLNGSAVDMPIEAEIPALKHPDTPDRYLTGDEMKAHLESGLHAGLLPPIIKVEDCRGYRRPVYVVHINCEA